MDVMFSGLPNPGHRKPFSPRAAEASQRVEADVPAGVLPGVVPDVVELPASTLPNARDWLG